MKYTEHVRGPPQRGSKLLSKQTNVTKMVSAVLRNTTRTDFIQIILGAHGLADLYHAGPHSGPNFKLWWTGIRYVVSISLCDVARIYVGPVQANHSQAPSSMMMITMWRSTLFSRSVEHPAWVSNSIKKILVAFKYAPSV